MKRDLAADAKAQLTESNRVACHAVAFCTVLECWLSYILMKYRMAYV